MASSVPRHSGMYMSRMIRSGWKSARASRVCTGSVMTRVTMPAELRISSVCVAWARESSTISTWKGS
ncbi:hypothetical protein D3C81_1919460 [compost metagenome]